MKHRRPARAYAGARRSLCVRLTALFSWSTVLYYSGVFQSSINAGLDKICAWLPKRKEDWIKFLPMRFIRGQDVTQTGHLDQTEMFNRYTFEPTRGVTCCLGEYVVVSVDPNDCEMRCGQLMIFWSMKTNTGNEWVGVTRAHIFAKSCSAQSTLYDQEEKLIGKIAYSGTWLVDEKADTTCDPKQIHVNRRMGEVIHVRHDLNLCFIRIDHDFPLRLFASPATLASGSNLPPGSACQLKTTNGQQNFVLKHPTQPNWIHWKTTPLDED